MHRTIEPSAYGIGLQRISRRYRSVHAGADLGPGLAIAPRHQKDLRWCRGSGRRSRSGSGRGSGEAHHRGRGRRHGSRRHLVRARGHESNCRGPRGRDRLRFRNAHHGGLRFRQVAHHGPGGSSSEGRGAAENHEPPTSPSQGHDLPVLAQKRIHRARREPLRGSLRGPVFPGWGSHLIPPAPERAACAASPSRETTSS
jgi:hypothetical protein